MKTERLSAFMRRRYAPKSITAVTLRKHIEAGRVRGDQGERLECVQFEPRGPWYVQAVTRAHTETVSSVVAGLLSGS